MKNRIKNILLISFLIFIPSTIYCQYVKEVFKNQKLTVAIDSIKTFISTQYISPTLIDGEDTFIILPDTLPDGLWLAYFKDDTSKIACKYEFKNRVRNGKSELFWKNGIVKEMISYTDGKKDGRYISYYGNGQIKDEAFYIKGQQHGLWIRYYENGIQQLVVNYNFDTELSPSLFWDQNGIQIKSLTDTHKQYFNFK